MQLVKDIKTQIVRVYDERVKLNTSDIELASLSFACNAQRYIDEAVSGKVFVNDLDKYVIDKQQDIENYKTGNFQPWLGFWQHAIYLKTGQSIPVMN